jgi:hypothetical protein
MWPSKSSFAAGYRQVVMSFSRSQTRTPCKCQLVIPALPLDLSLLVVEDITVTSIQNGHGGAAEELAASGAELNLRRGRVSMRTGTLQSLQRDFFSG